MIYITGASGFIGKHLTVQLALKDQVVIIPHEDISKVKLEPFDSFYFLSSYGNLASHKDEDMIFKANITDLMDILMQVKDMKFRSFVYVSSSSVKLRNQTTYSRCKKAAEEILLAVMEKHNLPITIIRPFSVTGVGEQEEHLIPLLLSGKIKNFNPSPVHDFIDVSDVVSGILNLTGHRGVYELGTGIKTTNQEVLELVEEITGKKIKVNNVDNLRPYDNTEWVSNNFRSRSFGWLPRKTLKDSIKEMYEASI